MVLEDGTGLPDSNSYVSRAVADDWHEQRANSAWFDADTDERETALIRATDYIDAKYAHRAVQLTAEQALQYPRATGSWEADLRSLTAATALLALYALSTDLYAPVTARDVLSEEKALEGVGSTSVTYADKAVSDPFPIITDLLRKIKAARLSSAGGTMRLSL